MAAHTALWELLVSLPEQSSRFRDDLGKRETDRLLFWRGGAGAVGAGAGRSRSIFRENRYGRRAGPCFDPAVMGISRPRCDHQVPRLHTLICDSPPAPQPARHARGHTNTPFTRMLLLLHASVLIVGLVLGLKAIFRENSACIAAGVAR